MRRHVLVHDTLRQTLNDSRLTNAWLANQHRIIFRTPAKNSNHTFQLFIAPDHCVKLACRRFRRQVNSKRAKRTATYRSPPRLGRDIAVLTAIFLERIFKFIHYFINVHTHIAQQRRSSRITLAQHAIQDMLSAQKIVIIFFSSLPRHAQCQHRRLA